MSSVESTPAPSPADRWVWAALVVAVAGSAGSLFLSLGLGLRACPLCFYQRAFMLAAVVVLCTGKIVGGRAGQVCLVALALAVAGLGVALFHVGLEVRGALECPTGVLGLGTAPQQSLAGFVVLTAVLVVGSLAGQTGSVPWRPLAAAVALGVTVAGLSLVANPPMPERPKRPYEAPPDICRPPFVAQAGVFGPAADLRATPWTSWHTNPSSGWPASAASCC
jgi:disulfide bond formation protein DsbB